MQKNLIERKQFKAKSSATYKCMFDTSNKPT